MSLRMRLNLAISAVFLAGLLVAAALVIGNARQSVARELSSSLELGRGLVEAVLARPGDGELPVERLRSLVRTLEATRHLEIVLPPADVSAGRSWEPAARSAAPPQAPGWFARLVTPAGPGRVLPAAGRADGVRLGLRPDPADEVAEAWAEARPLLVLMVAFAALAHTVLTLVVGRSLRPLDGIQRAMGALGEDGYGQRLPRCTLPELTRISETFNRMAARLERSTEQNRALTRRLHSVQEEERHHVARELHDELGQCLTAIRTDAVAIARADPDAPGAARERARRIAGLAEHVSDAARGLVRRLWPATLDTLGLTTTLRETVREWNDLHPGVECRFEADPGCDAAPDDVRITLYRALQEALTNVARHAGAARVEVSLWRRGDGRACRIGLIVRDDGRGLAPGAERRGVGLRGMAERVRALHGTFVTEPGPAGGTRLEITIALPAAAEAVGP